MLLGLHNIKLPAPSPYGIADTDESAILVLDAHTIELPANLNTLTQADAVAYMRYLSVANRVDIRTDASRLIRSPGSKMALRLSPAG